MAEQKRPEWMLTDKQIYDVLDAGDDALEGYTYEGEGGSITTCDVHRLLIAGARKLVEEYGTRCFDLEHEQYRQTRMPESKHACFGCWQELRKEVGL